MKTYIIRSLKYFLSLVILFVVISAFMILSGLESSEHITATLLANRGIFMMVLLVILSAIYPYFGYVKREIECQFDEQKAVKVLDACGYRLIKRTEQGALVFKANTLIRTIKTMGEDKITLNPSPSGVSLQGLRKEIVRIEFRLTTFLKNNEI